VARRAGSHHKIYQPRPPHSGAGALEHVGLQRSAHRDEIEEALVIEVLLNDVVMPEIGVSTDEGTLARWLKQAGDTVSAGQPIAEIETDKAAVELESPVYGVLGRHLVAAGATALQRWCACSRRASASMPRKPASRTLNLRLRSARRVRPRRPDDVCHTRR
jgi:hypothetical protein